MNAADQIITTVVGGGSLGDGGPATTAQLFAPWGVVRDASDNLFISDTQAYRVRKVDLKTGIITTYAGNGDANYGGDGGPATAASFFQPWGLAIDAAGNLYIATRFGRIRRVDANTGIITTVAGNDNPDRFTGDDPQASQRPLYLDGLEQSVDPTRGTRWLLLLNETAGSPATVTVRLYEAGNRSAAIAEKNFSLTAHQQLKLDTVFSAMDLDTEDRRKDRTNVLVAVTSSGGDGVVAASAISIDNRTGETRSFVLSPSNGPAGGVQKATLTSPTPSVPRRRPVRRD